MRTFFPHFILTFSPHCHSERSEESLGSFARSVPDPSVASLPQDDKEGAPSG